MSFFTLIAPVVQSIAVPTNPYTGAFGSGLAAFLTTRNGSSGTWTVPSGVTAVRLRLWGGGAPAAGTTGGGGGGFLFVPQLGVIPGQVISYTIGGSSGNTLVSYSALSLIGYGATGATGGSAGILSGSVSGTVVNAGGSAQTIGSVGTGKGGGAGSLLGPGGWGGEPNCGGSGGGSASDEGNPGFSGAPGGVSLNTYSGLVFGGKQFNQAAVGSVILTDLIGTGPGGYSVPVLPSSSAIVGGAGANGGGGGGGSLGGSTSGNGGNGGWPGGGGGGAGTAGGSGGIGAAGLFIIEY